MLGSLGQQTFDIDRFGFVFGLALGFAIDRHTGHTVKVVVGIFPRPGNQQILFSYTRS